VLNELEITVKVPEGYLGEFYLSLGRVWRNAEDEARNGADDTDAAESDLGDWVDNDFELDIAGQVWRKFSSNAKAMFSLLMDNPGDAMTGEELAERLGLPNGKYGVAGILAWPGRHCAAVDRVLLCRFEEASAPGASGTYWIDQEVANLFTKVRHGTGRVDASR
jgi:hypothetical protein